MERNTKILLGVGAGVLAYLLYRASRSQSTSVPGPTPSPTPDDVKTGAYRVKEDIIGSVVYGPNTLRYEFKAGDLIQARPFSVERMGVMPAGPFVTLKTTIDGKMPCEGFSCLGEVWVDIPLSKVEFSGTAITHGGSGASSSEPKSQADCPPGTTFSYQPTGEASCPPGTPRELGCSPRMEYKPMCVKNIEPGESILKGVMNSFDGRVGSTFSEWDTPIQNYGYGSLGSGLGLQGI